MAIDNAKVQELLLQGLETEQGGVEIYKRAVAAAVNEDLREEFTKYLEQTQRHVEIVTELCEALGIDASQETPGRKVVAHIGKSLAQAIEKAQQAGDPNAAQLVACECVVLAETKDHLNWELLEQLSKDAKGELKKALQAAVEEVEEEEDKHLYHTQGWTRELWLETLGLRSVVPPPEEEKDVTTAIGAARAKQQRTEMM
jgi:rubrerythrin